MSDVLSPQAVHDDSQDLVSPFSADALSQTALREPRQAEAPRVAGTPNISVASWEEEEDDEDDDGAFDDDDDDFDDDDDLDDDFFDDDDDDEEELEEDYDEED